MLEAMSPPSQLRLIRLIALMLCAAPLLIAAAPPGSRVTSMGVALAGEAASHDWHWPVDAPRRIVQPFLAPATPYAAGHRGIDIHAVKDGDVLAAANGVVHFSGIVVDRPVLSIRHPGGLISSIEPVESLLAVGTTVHRGQVIGTVTFPREGSRWSETHCVMPCVHFGVRLHGEYVSPLLLLGGVPRSVLLPTRSLR